MTKHRAVSGTKIRELRESRRLTQHDLASILRRAGFGTTQTTVSRWEDGQKPQSSVIPALAEALGVGLLDLYSDEDEEAHASMPPHRDMMETLYYALGFALGKVEA